MTGQRAPLLIVLGGLPGTGKTTVSYELITRLAATYIRIDTIEQVLQAAGLAVNTTGYAVANALAAENLRLGRTVVADCVNPVLASRIAWRQTAERSSARVVEIELVCTDSSLHRQRVESRSAGIGGLKLPTWEEVVNRKYEPWDREHLVLDTATGSPAYLAEHAEAYIYGAH